MPYDGPQEPAPASDVLDGGEAHKANRRGPLRPERLASARTRLQGETLALWVRLTDLGVLIAMALAGAVTAWNRLETALYGIAAVFGWVMLRSFDVYRFNSRDTVLRHLRRVLGALGGSSLATMACARLVFRSTWELDAGIVTWCLRVTACCAVAHLLWLGSVRRLRRSGALTPNLVVVGATPTARRLIQAALRSRDAHVLGVFDDRRTRLPKDLAGVPLLGSTAELLNHRILPYVDRIVLAVPSDAGGRISELLARLAPLPNPISLLLDPADDIEATLEGRSNESRVLDLPLADLTGRSARAAEAALKRGCDVVAASLALLVLMPAFAAIALAIKLDSPGPVFFRQRRHGYLNEELVVWKFRSMRSDAEDATAARQVSAGDDRVTRVGRFLRRTSLDELPQLLNVIGGGMSLVGPRPHAIGMLSGGEDASRLVQAYAHRHRIKPGLTGWAAVNGSRGPVDSPDAVRRRVALDLEYIERQSFWLDLVIILRTLPCLLGDSAAVR